MSSPEDDPARRNAEARAAVTASLNAVGSSLDGDLKNRAKDLHTNAAVISKQEKELVKQTGALSKQSAQWQKLVDSNTKRLNEIGDLQNWAEMIERDLLVVEETLRLAEGGRVDEGAQSERMQHDGASP